MANLAGMNLLEKGLDWHRRHRWLTHLSYWVLVLGVMVSASKYSDGKAGTWWFEIVSDALYQVPEIIAAYALTYWVIPKLFFRRRYAAGIIAFVGIAYLTSVLGRIFIVKIDEPLAGIAPKSFETYREIFTNVPKLLYVYFFQIFSVAFFFLCLKTLKDQVLIRQRTLILEKEKAETELKLLKTQLNPHFLFNTLNNIYSLSFTSQERTSASIARLADILDHILYRSHHRYVPLRGEIALIRNYIELEKLRYDSRLRLTFTVAGDEKGAIAPLLLLSLVENAFKHGASNDAGEPVIDIRLEVKDGWLEFEIANSVPAPDSGNGVGGAVSCDASGRIGLRNLRRQLTHLYGEEHELSVSSDDRWFRVKLAAPLKQDQTQYEKDKVLAGR